MALAKDPALLILDEPTTGLDATVEAEVLDLVANLQAELEHGRALHQPQPRRDLEDVRPRRRAVRGPPRRGRARSRPSSRTRATRTPSACCAASRVAASARTPGGSTPSRASSRSSGQRSAGLRLRRPLRARGRSLPDGGARDDRGDTRSRRPLLPPGSSPRSAASGGAEIDIAPIDRSATPVVRFEDLGKVFKQQGADIHALVGVSAAIWPGETLGLVGESGSGKTTLARTLLGIVGPTSGAVELDGRAAGAAVPEALAGRPARAPDRVPEPRLGTQPPPLGAAGS